MSTLFQKQIFDLPALVWERIINSSSFDLKEITSPALHELLHTNDSPSAQDHCYMFHIYSGLTHREV